MTVSVIPIESVIASINQLIPDAQAHGESNCVVIGKDSIADVMNLLRTSSDYEFEYLSSITAVDYFEYFEVVYHLTSIAKRHSLTIKTRCEGRDNLEVPSVTPIWQGADLQEREIFDLFGIRFTGHPNMKRIVLWEGFDGHPLRKDYL